MESTNHQRSSSARVALSEDVNDNEIRVSDEDRGRIAVLEKTIKDLEGQVARIVGNHGGLKDPKLVPLEESDNDARADIFLRVVDNQAELERCFAMIYVDPPGICKMVCG